MEGAGESLTKSVSVPMAAAGTAAIKFASESQDAYKQFAAATGTATENLGKYQDMINNVYKDNFGESIGDVADAMAKVDQNMSYLDDSALQRCTEYAYTLADTFDVDIGESTRAADSLIKNFGVSAREAFNLMAQGAQNGLDFSGELFDNIDEYSVQFQKLGLDAEDMFSIFANGAENGAFNLDKIGDAVKEFSIRAIDGSDTTKMISKMEIWLKCGKDSIQLPILPASYNVTRDAGHETVNVQNLGDVTILGKRGLSSIELESFFPNKDYSFAAYKKKQSPWEYVKKILSWQEKTLRLVVTKTKINMQVVISSFSYGEEDGTGDIKYKLSLMEYRAPKYTKPKKKKTSKTAASTTKKNIKQGTKRETSKTKAKVHIVSGNDTLWSISKKYYGTGSYANKIYEANKTIIERTAVKHGFRSSANKGVNGWWIFDGERLVIP